MAQNEYLRGLKLGFPICLGYIPVAFTFGLIAVKMGFDPWIAVLIAFTNLASAGQFAGIRLIEGGAPFIEVAITNCVINLRYMLMSFSLTQKIAPNIPFYKRCLMAIGITDEVFALAMISEGKDEQEIKFPFFMGLMSSPIFGWTFGTFLGAFVSGLLPPLVQNCLGIALYCMFIAVIMPPARKGRKVAISIIAAALLSTMFTYVPVMNIVAKWGSGWVIIISSVSAAAICASIKERKRTRRKIFSKTAEL